MGEKPKVLIAGCGSIGRRHIRNLRELGVRDFVLCDPSEAALDMAAEGLESPRRVDNFADALDSGADAAVIATPSSMHMEMSTALAGKGTHLFIEKPLSHTLDGAEALIKLVEELGVAAMMAMCYRFHPVYIHIKKLLDADSIGTVFHVNAYGGHYLPDWHPNADYKVEYAANKSLGGGVVLTCIHGFDNIRWLFGEVAELACFIDRVGVLEMDVEDIAMGIFKMESGVYINWQMDFLQRTNQNKLVAVGEKGTLRCDMVTGVIETFSADYGKWYVEEISFDINTMYLEEMRHFLDCIANKKKPRVDIFDGYKTLKLAIDVKKAGDRTGGDICLTG